MFPPVAAGYPPRMKASDLALASCIFIIGFSIVGISFVTITFINLIIYNETAVNYLGSGFWIYGLGCGASLIGGIAQAFT